MVFGIMFPFKQKSMACKMIIIMYCPIYWMLFHFVNIQYFNKKLTDYFCESFGSCQLFIDICIASC
jgi:hypothetical protein